MVAIGSSIISGGSRATSGSAIQGNVGDVWQLDLRGSFVDNVATSTRMLFRQNDTYNPDINVAEQLVDDFKDDPNGPLQNFISNASNQLEYVCIIVTNLAVENSLAETFSLSGAVGQIPGEIVSTMATANLKYADDTGNGRGLKTLYFPGFASLLQTDGVITSTGNTGLKALIEKLYNFGGPGNVNWSWVYGLVDGVYQRANNGHPDPFVSRLYSRNPSLC